MAYVSRSYDPPKSENGVGWGAYIIKSCDFLKKEILMAD